MFRLNPSPIHVPSNPCPKFQTNYRPALFASASGTSDKLAILTEHLCKADNDGAEEISLDSYPWVAVKQSRFGICKCKFPPALPTILLRSPTTLCHLSVPAFSTSE
jgi:hypothetical protein